MTSSTGSSNDQRPSHDDQAAAERRASARAEARWRALARWEHSTSLPMFVVAVVFFAASSLLLIDVQLSADAQSQLTSVVSVSWALFIVEFLIRLVISPVKLTFVRSRWFDLLSLFVVVLRPFLIVTYLWRLPFFRRGGPRAKRTRNVLAVSIASLLYVYTASLGVYLVEHKTPGASIVSMGDALWWGFTTITTVGYGDFTPVTLAGRALAVSLMVSGVLIVGFVSATIMSAIREDAQTIAAKLTTKAPGVEAGGSHHEQAAR
ncbi:potassium channel family protein [Pseudoclavibacter sp. AY1H1]|uniref:potassium channel family protein n=1 Tax=Pseudoclavibacter sp. AY1H1 TaxID=2080584 RepID=UPI000CE899BA|nr:potassium channel family protein [Pseudoclavibacter sp. AY1H1]PPF32290.1 Ion transport 2 domain protein [Pseudoclavibacter sp. AY1H1]